MQCFGCISRSICIVALHCIIKFYSIIGPSSNVSRNSGKKFTPKFGITMGLNLGFLEVSTSLTQLKLPKCQAAVRNYTSKFFKILLN